MSDQPVTKVSTDTGQLNIDRWGQTSI